VTEKVTDRISYKFGRNDYNEVKPNDGTPIISARPRPRHWVPRPR